MLGLKQYCCCSNMADENTDSFQESDFNEVPKAHLLPTIVICGPPDVGKTSLYKRFKQHKNKDGNDSVDCLNDSTAKTQGIEYEVIEVSINNDCRDVRVYDTSGQIFSSQVLINMIKKAHSVLIVYSAVDAKSFLSVRDFAFALRKRDPSVRITLLANKSDLERDIVVPEDEGDELAAELGVRFMHTNVSETTKIVDVFHSVVIDSLYNKSNSSYLHYTAQFKSSHAQNSALGPSFPFIQNPSRN